MELAVRSGHQDKNHSYIFEKNCIILSLIIAFVAMQGKTIRVIKSYASGCKTMNCKV